MSIREEARAELESIVQAEDERWDGSRSAVDFSTQVADAILAAGYRKVTEDVVSTLELEHAWRDGYFTGKRDYAGSITGGVSISTPNPYRTTEGEEGF